MSDLQQTEKKTDKTITITVNGRQKEVPKKEELSYDEVVNLAFNNTPPTGENVVITVTYSKGIDGKQGSLVKGATVKAKDGMIFNVTATDKS